ncbi:MAG: PTS sugar transporter subunit IIA [Candidatus Cloacimonetes bacterium]|nr:PTS sugar transporter subunit IIA [Candidatus Cloacimonadota bacterium]
MKIFSQDLIKLNYYALDKKSCLREMVELLAEQGVVVDNGLFLNAILEREKLMSTGIGRGIAIPHARGKVVAQFKIAIYLLENKLDFDSIDGEPVSVIFMIAVPDNMKEEYIRVLSLISNFCKDQQKVEKLFNAGNALEVYEMMQRIEDEI